MFKEKKANIDIHSRQRNIKKAKSMRKNSF